jgi:glycosyltransferase involved in cell wall biosynthesis
MSTKISIVTPLFNRRELVEETWHSINAQSYSHWEWIVVDDGSSDGGPSFIKDLGREDGRVKFFEREGGQKGPSSCRNMGVKLCEGEYVMFLDSDDLISPDCLEKRLFYLEQNPGLDFAVFPQALFTGSVAMGTTPFSKYFNGNDQYLQSFLADQHPWCISGPLWRKGSFNSTGGFREDYAMMEDPELHIRAILMGLKFAVARGEADFYYRQTPKTKEQEELFWANSIKGRIVFYRDLVVDLKSRNLLHAYQQSVEYGVKMLFKTFLLSRIGRFVPEYNQLVAWGVKNGVVSRRLRFLLTFYLAACQNQILAKIPFLKGIIYKLI